jgi:phosphate/sulfate permease
MTEIRNSILAGLAFALFFGVLLWLKYDIHTALISGPLSGLAFGTILYFFVISKTIDRQTQLTNADGEKIICSAKANHFLNGEAVGGKLYLLADRLEFKSHRFNAQNHVQKITLREVQKVSFYNVLGIVPNGLSITLTNGKTEKYVISSRRVWRDKIEKLKNRTTIS